VQKTARREPEVPVEVVLDDGSSRVAVARNIIVQVRTGRLTIDALDRMLAIWRTRLAPRNVPVFGIFVIGADAEMPPPKTHERQREVLREVYERGLMRGALVVEGTGIFVKLRKEMLSSMIGARPLFYTAEEAALHLAREDGAPSAAELLAVVAVARGS
jgi:hypothetical protein